MKRIVTLTINPAIDTNLRIGHVVAERKLRCRFSHHEPGGGGINVSRAIQRLGGQSLALYTAGGLYGQLLGELLKKEGVNCQPIPIQELTRENFIVLEESSGQQYRFGTPGPKLGASECHQCLEVLSGISPNPDYIVVSGSHPQGTPRNFYAQVGSLAREKRARLLVDTSGDALRLALPAGLYLLKPNIRELQELTGQEIKDESQQEAVTMELVKSGQCEAVVVSLGAAGVLLVSKKGCQRLRAPTVPIKSKVGAGDSMMAGIVLSLARGKSLKEAVRFGVAAGSAAVMTAGTELCHRNDTEQLYQQLLAKAGSRC